MGSLEELSLLKCLSPDVLEKYFLKIVDTLDIDFINNKKKEIMDLIESRSQLFIVVITNEAIGRFTIFKDLNSKDILDIFTIIFNKSSSNGLMETDTSKTMINCFGGTNRTYTEDDIINDFKNMLVDGTKTCNLVGRKFNFRMGCGHGVFLKIHVFKSQDQLDKYIEGKTYKQFIIKFTRKKQYEKALAYW